MVLDGLEASDRLAELLALLCVGHRVVEHPSRAAGRLGRPDDAHLTPRLGRPRGAHVDLCDPQRRRVVVEGASCSADHEARPAGVLQDEDRRGVGEGRDGAPTRRPGPHGDRDRALVLARLHRPSFGHQRRQQRGRHDGTTPHPRDLNEVTETRTGPAVLLGDADQVPTALRDDIPRQRLLRHIHRHGSPSHAAGQDLGEGLSSLDPHLAGPQLVHPRHFGSPRMRSAMMLRWISEVPE